MAKRRPTTDLDRVDLPKGYRAARARILQSRAADKARAAAAGKVSGDDWRRIERAHATGRYSDAQLAARFQAAGLTVQRLRDKRTRDRKKDPAAWAVNLSGDVRRATAAVLAHQATLAAGADADAVMAAAREVAGVLTRHRQDARRARDVAMVLLDELEGVSVGAEGLRAIVAKVGQDLGAEDRLALHGQLRNLMTLHNRIGSIQRAADALHRLQHADRRAWGIGDDSAAAASDPFESMSSEQLAAEVKRLERELERSQSPAGGNVVPMPARRAR